MQIVIKAENGNIYFNPKAIKCGKEIIRDDGTPVFPIVLESEFGSVAVSGFYPRDVVKAVVNDIYESIANSCCDVLRDHDDIWERGATSFDIKALIEEFQDQEK